MSDESVFAQNGSITQKGLLRGIKTVFGVVEMAEQTSGAFNVTFLGGSAYFMDPATVEGEDGKVRSYPATVSISGIGRFPMRIPVEQFAQICHLAAQETVKRWAAKNGVKL